MVNTLVKLKAFDEMIEAMDKRKELVLTYTNETRLFLFTEYFKACTELDFNSKDKVNSSSIVSALVASIKDTEDMTTESLISHVKDLQRSAQARGKL